MKNRKGIKKLLSLAGCQQFLKTLKHKEKINFFIFLFLALVSFLFLSFNFYLKNTEAEPAKGGTYIEGIVGYPLRINPVYSQENDADRDLAELIYSGLMKYDEKGELIFDLAQEYNILEQGRVFEFILKENLFWSDGEPLTADDVVFTVKSIQNPALKSHIRASWLGIEVEKISETKVRFELKSPSAIFLEKCTLKIMPKHIWQDVSDQNFPFSPYNLNPIGSGPYKAKEVNQNKEDNITSLGLTINPNYHGKKVYISEIIFKFFNNENELISAFNSNQINGFSLSSPEKKQNLIKNNLSSHPLLMPRYFAVFLNPEKEKLFDDIKIRQALSYGINKQEIIKQVLLDQGKTVDSPILSDIYSFEKPLKTYSFEPEKANDILTQAGFIKQENGLREKTIEKNPTFEFKSDLQVGSKGEEVTELQKCLANPPAGGPDIYPEQEVTGYFGEKTKTAVINFQEEYKQEILVPAGLTSGNGRVLASTRKKLNELCYPVSKDFFPLSLTLTTVNQSTLIETALFLKNSWQEIGINLEIETVSVPEIKEKIKSRNYEMLLFGQMLEIIPDPFPFWHSSQTKDPGLNLARYENKEVDELLEKARQTLDQEQRKINLEKFQNILIEDAPAIFLYNPNYLYLISENIKGFSNQIIVDPSKRFINIENWYIQTKRIWK